MIISKTSGCFFSSLFFALFTMQSAYACDPCALHGVMSIGDLREGNFVVGVTEQITNFESVYYEGRKVTNPQSQDLNSSITQVNMGYALSDRTSLQLSVPLIYRDYRRAIEGGGVERGSESGLGDASLIANYLVSDCNGLESKFRWQVFGGLKFPTGDSTRLKEELAPGHSHDFSAGIPEDSNVIHGHDIALGSGSVDVILGTGMSVQQSRWFVDAAAQYFIRTEGDYNYQIGDDLLWNVSPGRYLSVGHEHSIALSARLSGELKLKDELSGVKAADTRVNTVFLGPRLDVTIGEALTLNAALEFPIDVDNSSLQIVPTRRAIIGVNFKFS